MARYILINEHGTILGQKMETGNERTFVSIAEAYETLAKLTGGEGETLDEISESFRRWVLHEVRRVEDD